MDADTTHGQVKELLQLALEQPEPSRALFVEAAVGYQEQVRTEVLELLRAREDLPAVLAEGALLDYLSPAPTIQPGSRLGNYIVDRVLAEGDYATVFRARSADPEIDRPVAIKILNGGTRSEEALARFSREARVLSALAHPGIVRLYEVGRTPEGRPYYVMEFVDGDAIDKAAEALSATGILELFLRVAEAVSIAHRSLVVHRDLKPSNILVDPDGQPKILDFGIALLLSGDSRLTQPGIGPMTIRYASPEQVRGDRSITTLADVYSLSVLLYELLWKRSPYGEGLSLYQLASRIASGDVARPPGKRVSGDLEAIVFKGLSLNPERRYASVDRMADDTRRYLAGRPVAASPPSALRTAGKLIARNRVASSLIASLLVLVVTFVTLLYQERERALKRSAELTQLAGTSLGEVVEAMRLVPGSLRAVGLLYQKRVEVLEALVREEPANHEAKRKLVLSLFNLGTVEGHPRTASLGQLPDGLRSFQRALLLAEQAYLRRPGTEELVDICYAQQYLGSVYQAQGRLEEAREAFSACLTRMKRHLQQHASGSEDASAVTALDLSLLAVNSAMEQKGKDYDLQIAEAIQIRKRDLENASPESRPRMLRQLSISLALAAEGALALEEWSRALGFAKEGASIEEESMARNALPESDYYLSAHLLHAAIALRRLGETEEAERFARRALKQSEAATAREPDSLPFRHRKSRIIGELAELTWLLGDRDAAQRLREAHLALGKQNFEADETNRFLAEDFKDAQTVIDER